MIETVTNSIRNHLNQTTENINPWFDKPEDLRSYRPVNKGWTINEILEHIALTSYFLLKLIEKGGNKALKNAETMLLEEALKGYEFEDDKLTEIGLHKSFVWIRPEHMEPKGKMSLEEVKNTINEQKDRCLIWLDKLKNGEGVLAKTTMTVNGLGKIDVYQYIYFLSLHAQRHVSQMERNEEEYNIERH
jgi:DinB superfamily